MIDTSSRSTSTFTHNPSNSTQTHYPSSWVSDRDLHHTYTQTDLNFQNSDILKEIESQIQSKLSQEYNEKLNT